MDLNRGMKVSREAHGHVRKLSHPRRPLAAADLKVEVDSLTELASAYLSGVALVPTQTHASNLMKSYIFPLCALATTSPT